MRRFFLGLATCAVASTWPAIASADNKEFSQAVATTLRNSGRLVDYSIGVTTKDNVVYLKGRVANKEQMDEAMQMTSAMPGVTKVVNNLEIKSTAGKTATASSAGLNSVPGSTPMEQSAAKMALEAQGAAEEAMTNVRKTIFPDPSLPPQTATKRRAKATTTAAKTKKPSAATQKAYAVQQVSQNAPGAFTPSEGAQGMAAPQGMRGPQGMGGPQGMPGPQMMGVPRMAMAGPAAMAGMAAGAMGACPPGGCAPDGSGGMGGGGMGGPGAGGPMGMNVPAVSGGVAPARYDSPYMPNYAWPSYAAYPNYAAVSYPRQYSPTAWPYIGPFYPYPQVPLGWRKVTLEWDDGWWMLNFKQ